MLFYPDLTGGDNRVSTSLPLISESTFYFLDSAEQYAALNTYLTVRNILGEHRKIPSFVWMSFNNTLYRTCCGQDIFQGHAIGMLKAFKDAGSGIGIFSGEKERAIKKVLRRNPDFVRFFCSDSGGELLIRGADYLIGDGKKYSMPQYGIHANGDSFRIEQGGKAVYEKIPKFIKQGEILVDSFSDIPLLEKLDVLCEKIISDWRATHLAKVIRTSRDYFLNVKVRTSAGPIDHLEAARLKAILDLIDKP